MTKKVLFHSAFRLSQVCNAQGKKKKRALLEVESEIKNNPLAFHDSFKPKKVHAPSEPNGTEFKTTIGFCRS